MKVYVVLIDYGYDGGYFLDRVFSNEDDAKVYCEKNTSDLGDYPFDGSVLYRYQERELI